MYYRVEHAQIIWRNQILQAKPVGATAHYQMRQKPHWWDAEPWVPPPPPLTFAINFKAQLLDNYFTGTLFDLYSGRLIKLLRDAEVQFELFPATIIDQKSHEVLTAVTDKKSGETLP